MLEIKVMDEDILMREFWKVWKLCDSLTLFKVTFSSWNHLVAEEAQHECFSWKSINHRKKIYEKGIKT